MPKLVAGGGGSVVGFGAFCPEFRRLKSHSSCQIRVLSKSFSRSCPQRFVVLTPMQYQYCSRERFWKAHAERSAKEILNYNKYNTMPEKQSCKRREEGHCILIRCLLIFHFHSIRCINTVVGSASERLMPREALKKYINTINTMQEKQSCKRREAGHCILIRCLLIFHFHSIRCTKRCGDDWRPSPD